MDWTTNPLVALYFAVRETKKDENGKPMNSAVYVLISDPYRFTDFNRKQLAVKPVKDLATEPATSTSGYEEFGVEGIDPEESEEEAAVDRHGGSDRRSEETAHPPVPSPFEITENVIYHPPHISPRLRAQDSVLLACHSRSRRSRSGTASRSSFATTPTTTSAVGSTSTVSSTGSSSRTWTASQSGFATGSSRARGRYDRPSHKNS